MNKIDFTKTGGFPFDQSTLGFMQESILLASQAAGLGGPLSILSGCVEIGQSVSAGYVYINGEILPFKQGTKSATVVIVEQIESLQYFDNLAPKPVKTIRYAQFGSDSVTNYQWADFTRYTLPGLVQMISNISLESLGILHRDIVPIGDACGKAEGMYSDKVEVRYNQGGSPNPDYNNEYLHILFGKTLPTDNYIVFLNIVSQDDAWEDTTIVSYTIRDRLTDGFSVVLKELDGQTQDLAIMYMIVKM